MSHKKEAAGGIGKKVTSLVKRMKGHRAHVTKTINKAKELLETYQVRFSSRLQSYKESLEEKCFILEGLDSEVLCTLDDEQSRIT